MARTSPFYFFSGAFLTVIFLYVLWHFGFMPNVVLRDLGIESRTSVRVLNTSPSPDEEYVSITRQVENYDGWCEVRTNVDKMGTVSDWETDFVFITNCSADLNFVWDTGRSLTITYSSLDPLAGIKTSQQSWSKDKAVRITYVLKQ